MPRKHVLISNLRVHEQVIVYHRAGFAMVTMIALTNKYVFSTNKLTLVDPNTQYSLSDSHIFRMKKIVRQYHV